MTADQMAEHVRSLCASHQIQSGTHSRGGRAFRESRLVCFKPVKSAITYAIALHEIGHLLGPWQSQGRLFSEAGAWQWAKHHAIEWTPTMDKKMHACLLSYLRWAEAKQARGVKNAPKIPLKEHAFWQLLGTV